METCYKVIVKEGEEGKFEEYLEAKEIPYRKTRYTKTLIVFGVYLSNEEEKETIKSLDYVTRFEVMPIATLDSCVF